MSVQKITVIIPTRERCDVLEQSLRTVQAQNYDNLEIIVSDNFSRDDTENVVRSANDARVKYLNTGKRVSMSHNWEFALSNVTEGWVTIIGDDDGLLPNSLNKVAEIINSTDVRAIRTSTCSYLWPSLTGKEYGRLQVPLRSGYEVRSSRLWLSKVLNGRANYTELPMLYNGGYVSMSVIDKIKYSTGSFYKSCIPDIYSAVSISSVVDKYIYSNEPLGISGASKHSTGTSHMSKRHSKNSHGTAKTNKLRLSERIYENDYTEDEREKSPIQKFISEENIPFHKDIPLYANGGYVLSLQAMVYESYLQSKCLRGETQENIHAQQLEVILATAGEHDALVRQWGKIFASIHKLDYERIQSKASRRKILLGVTSVPCRISNAINTYSIGSQNFPIKDVYEASIAATALRKSMPSRLRNVYRLFGRALEKMIR